MSTKMMKPRNSVSSLSQRVKRAAKALQPAGQGAPPRCTAFRFPGTLTLFKPALMAVCAAAVCGMCQLLRIDMGTEMITKMAIVREVSKELAPAALGVVLSIVALAYLADAKMWLWQLSAVGVLLLALIAWRTMRRVRADEHPR